VADLIINQQDRLSVATTAHVDKYCLQSNLYIISRERTPYNL